VRQGILRIPDAIKAGQGRKTAMDCRFFRLPYQEPITLFQLPGECRLAENGKGLFRITKWLSL
jgi:hypothetical protein